MPFLDPPQLFQLGRALRPLRDDGVLVVGSGGIVHSLSRVRFADKDAPVDEWAAEFDAWVALQVWKSVRSGSCTSTAGRLRTGDCRRPRRSISTRCSW
jgi:aromatic ring-opening dioxygenase catalytic subunit (LigB family)